MPRSHFQDIFSFSFDFIICPLARLGFEVMADATETALAPWNSAPQGFWDAHAVLSLLRSEHNEYACLGTIAPEHGPCDASLPSNSRASVRDIIRRLQSQNADTVARTKQDDLRRLAGMLLCERCARDQQSNVDRILQAWLRALSDTSNEPSTQRWRQYEGRYSVASTMTTTTAISVPSVTTMTSIPPMASATTTSLVEAAAEQLVSAMTMGQTLQPVPLPPDGLPPDPSTSQRATQTNLLVAPPSEEHQSAQLEPYVRAGDRTMTPELDEEEGQRVEDHYSLLQDTLARFWVQRDPGTRRLRPYTYSPEEGPLAISANAIMRLMDNHIENEALLRGATGLLREQDRLPHTARNNRELERALQGQEEAKNGIETSIRRLETIRAGLALFEQSGRQDDLVDGDQLADLNEAENSVPIDTWMRRQFPAQWGWTSIPGSVDEDDPSEPEDAEQFDEDMAFMDNEMEAVPVFMGEFARFDCPQHVFRRELDEECCSICLEPWADRPLSWCKAQCGENFHKHCIAEWLMSSRGTCPKW